MQLFSSTHESALKIVSRGKLGPRSATDEASPAVGEFGRSGESIFWFWARVLVEHGNIVGAITLDVSRGKLGPRSATHEASPASRRVWAIGRVDLLVLGEGAGRTPAT